MDAWWESSPYAAVGIYIGGSNRLCTQPELDAGWVRKQQRRGWHLLPVQVGPQASCSGYADRMSSDLATAEQQGRAEARHGRRDGARSRDRDGQHALLRPRGLRHRAGRLPSRGAVVPLGLDEGAARQGLRLRGLLQHRCRHHLPRLRRRRLARLLRDARRHLVRLGERQGGREDRRAGLPQRPLGRPRPDPPVRPGRRADLRRLPARGGRELGGRRRRLGRLAVEGAVQGRLRRPQGLPQAHQGLARPRGRGRPVPAPPERLQQGCDHRDVRRADRRRGEEGAEEAGPEGDRQARPADLGGAARPRLGPAPQGRLDG